VAEGLKEVMATALLLIILATLVLVAVRWRDIPTRALSDKLLSRDSVLVLMILSMIVLAVVVGIGTSIPLISGIPGVGHQMQAWLGGVFKLDNGTLLNPQAQPLTDGRFSLTPDFYNRTTPPLALVVITLMIIGPLLGWRDTNTSHLLRALRLPLLAAVVGSVVAILLGVRAPQSLAYVGLGIFAIGTNTVMIVRTLKSGVLRIGGYLAHVGLAVLMIGVVGSTAYATPDERVVLTKGDGPIKVFGYDLVFNGWRQTPDGKGVLDVAVTKGGDTFTGSPQLWFNPRMGATMATPAVRT
jgi:cytochrome c-type biogenesis protein CcmF